jgi:hypothetical protein
MCPLLKPACLDCDSRHFEPLQLMVWVPPDSKLHYDLIERCKAKLLLYVSRGLTIKIFTFCPQSAFMFLCMVLSTVSTALLVFIKRCLVCLLRGTNGLFKCVSGLS